MRFMTLFPVFFRRKHDLRSASIGPILNRQPKARLYKIEHLLREGNYGNAKRAHWPNTGPHMTCSAIHLRTRQASHSKIR